jgi:hypothetical protein
MGSLKSARTLVLGLTLAAASAGEVDVTAGGVVSSAKVTW